MVGPVNLVSVVVSVLTVGQRCPRYGLSIMFLFPEKHYMTMKLLIMKY